MVPARQLYTYYADLYSEVRTYIHNACFNFSNTLFTRKKAEYRNLYEYKREVNSVLFLFL